MKNIFILSMLYMICFGCNNASNKIQDKNVETTNQNNTIKPSSTEKDTKINAQIIDNGGAAAFEFLNEGGTVWNFGEINQGESPEFTFLFKNSGNEPMIISNAKGSCGCTVPVWPKEPIAPGDTGEISVKFNSKNKQGSQNKTVTLTANTTPPTTKLRVTGQINVPQ